MSLSNENIQQKGEIPEITKLPNGRIRVVRRFHKFTREDVDDANLGTLMGEFGDLDNAGEQIVDQGYDDCTLISVEVDNRFNAVSNTENPVLVKTYETLTDSFVQIDDDTESTTESGLKTVTKVFRAKSGTTNSDTVGTTTSGGLTLASSKLVDNDAFAELTQVFSETGIVSVDIDSKYGGVITLTTVTGFNIDVNQAQALSNAAGTFLDQQTKNKGGFETDVFRFVDGSGEIDRSVSEQGVLKKTTITSVNEHPTHPTGVLVDQRTDTRDFGIIYTHTYAEGSGTVSEVESLSFNGKLKTTSVTALGTEPVIPDGAAIISSATSVENGIQLFKLTHVQGQGEISRSTNPNYNGAINVITVTSLNEEPVAAGDLVDTDVKAGDGYILYTYQFAAGQGEVSRSSSQEYGGALTKTVISSINEEPTHTGALVSTSVSANDGFTLYTYTFCEGSGEVSRSTSTEHNGILTKTTITSVNEEPSEAGALVDTKVTANNGFTLYTYTFATGSGEVTRSTSSQGVLTKTTIVSINELPAVPANSVLVDSTTDTGDYGIIYTQVFAQGSGQVSEVVSTSHNGALTTVSVTSLVEEPVVPDGAAIIESSSSIQDGLTLFKLTHVSGQGQVSTSESTQYNGALTKTIITSINEEPNGSGALVKTDVKEGNGYLLYTYTYCEGTGEVSRSINSEYNGALTRTVITSINEEPNGGTSALVATDVKEGDGYILYTYTFLDGSGEISRSTSTEHNGILTKTTISSINIEPVNTGALVGTRVDTKDGYVLYTYTFAEGTGEVTRSTSSQGVLTKTTIVSINELPDPPSGSVVVESRTDTGDYGIIYTQTFASGEGQLSEVISRSFNGKLTTTSITSIGEEPVVPDGAAIIESSSSIQDGITLFKLTHVQGQGQVSTSTNPNYGGALNLITITSLNEEPDGGSAELVDTDVKAGNGYILYTYTFAAGQGEVARQTNPEHNGALTRTTITSINVEPSSEGALVDSKVSTQDGFTLYEYTFVDGQGEVSRDERSEFNGALTKTTISSINQEPSGDGVLLDSKVDARDGFTLFTYTYVSGSGEVSRQTNPEYNGTLTKTTITSINEEPSGNGALVDSVVKEGNGYLLYTYTYCEGQGEVGRSTSQQYNNKLTLTTITTIDIEPQHSGALVESKVTAQDGYLLYIYTFAEGSGEISRGTSSEYNGTLTKTTITSINEEPDHSGALIDNKTTLGDGYVLYVYTYCEGTGEIGRSISQQYKDALTITTITTIGEEPNFDGALVKSEIKEGKGYLIYVYTYATGQGEIGRSVNTEYNGVLTKTTIISINEEPDHSGTLVDTKVQTQDGYVLYNYTFCEGKGEIARTESSQYNNKLKLTTIVSIDQEPEFSGALVKAEVQEGKGYLLYTYTFAEGQGQISESTNTEYDGKLTRTTITSINEEPNGSGALVDTNVKDGDGYILYTYSFVEGEGEIGRSESKQYNNQLTLTTIVSINTEPDHSGALVKTDVKTQDGYVLYTYTFAEGQGKISEQSNPEYDGKLIRTTITSINEEPDFDGSLVDSKTQAGDGFILYTSTYISGAGGEIARSVTQQYNDKLTLTTVTSVIQEPDEAGALVKADVRTEDGYALYIYTYAEGQGEISRQDNPEYDGKLTRTTITSINEEPDGSGSLVDSKTTSGDGYILYTNTYIDGAGGEIGRAVAQQYNNQLTLTTVTSVVQEPSESGALVKADVKTQDGYTLYTYTYAEGQGKISEQSNPEYDGKLTRTTITSINEEPNGSGALVDSKVVAGDGFILYTSTYVEGEGEIAKTTSEQYNGKLKLETISSIGIEPSGTGALIKSDVKTQDGYVLYTYTFATGQGEISRSTAEEHNGQLTKTTITSINEEPDGNGALVDTRLRAGDGYILYTYTFAEGEGEISRSTNTEHNNILTKTTVVSINKEPNEQGALVDPKVEQGDGYILYTYTYCEGQGQVSSSSNPEFDGVLNIETITSINEVPSGSGSLVDSKVDTKDGYTLYTYRFADGQGEIGKVTGTGKFYDTETISAVNEMPQGEGQIKESKIEAKDGFFIATTTFIKPKDQSEISRGTKVGPIPTSTIETVINVGSRGSGTGELYNERVDIQDGIEVFTSEFISVAGGTIASYNDAVEVEVAGEVECTSENISVGDVSGDIAVIKATPVSRKTVQANCSIEITDSPEVSEDTYSLEGVGCSVASVNASLQHTAGSTATTTSGIFTFSRTGFQKNVTSSANISTFSGCVLKSAQSSGSISYDSFLTYDKTADGGLNPREGSTSSQSKCVGSGSTDTPKVSGLLKSRVRPLLTLPSGKTYFEVIKWTA